MTGATKRDEPGKGSPPPPGRGTPPTAAVQATRKDVTVRVFLAAQPVPDSEELKEEGYGHGV